jgi:hypothetical protein
LICVNARLRRPGDIRCLIEIQEGRRMPDNTEYTAEDVRRLFGDISAHHIAEILASGATLNDLEEVSAHLAGETDVMGELERPLTGHALRIFQMLSRYDEQFEEEP